MHVLLVDDNVEILETFSQLLAEEGYLVTTSRSGLGALLRVGTRRPDAIILDLHLGDITGFDVFRALRADPDFGSIPIVFVSGVILDEAIVRARTGDPFVRLLIKPVTASELVEAVESEVRRSQRDSAVL